MAFLGAAGLEVCRMLYTVEGQRVSFKVYRMARSKLYDTDERGDGHERASREVPNLTSDKSLNDHS